MNLQQNIELGPPQSVLALMVHVIPSIDSTSAAHDEQKVAGGAYIDFDVCGGTSLGYTPFMPRSEKKRIEKLKYMYANPVKRGLVRHPGDSQWSS